MSVYELAILGSAESHQIAAITSTIGEMVADFGLTIGDDVRVFTAENVASRDKGVAFAATYFGGGESFADLNVVRELVADSAPIIPTIEIDGSFAIEIPPLLQSANGHVRRQDDPNMTELAAALLECVGLLRRQRRVFVSYRRTESRAAALQLHDLLSARGFDVFWTPTT